MGYKNSLGYKLGIKVRSYKDWKHPLILKILYPILLGIMSIVMFPKFFGYILMVILSIITLFVFLYVIGLPTTGEKILGELEEINERLRKLDKNKK